MKRRRALLPLWAASLVWIGGGAGTEVRAEHSRRSPIVEAVEKTRASVVAIKVEKSDGYDGVRESTGTGIIVDEHGYVVTSRHVIDGASRVRVQLIDGTEMEAAAMVSDRATDLAVLHVKSKKPLRALVLGPGSDLMVGETVIAVGHPYGYSNTVSTGIISALGRKIPMPSGEMLTNLIQTNACINPGNSGGPLLNINGELIGINAAVRDGAQGIAFAVNADTVKQMLTQYLSLETVAGADHGLKVAERVLPDGPNRQRVVVAKVGEETPAAKAGLKPGDEIVRVADHPVANCFDLDRALWDCKPGETVTMAVFREGKEMPMVLTLTSTTSAGPVAASRN
jgi:serine protease Do